MSDKKLIEFGHRAKDTNQPLEWYVLHQTETTQLLLCKDCLVKGPYLDSREKTFWEDSSIRTWLNETLYNSIFDSEEQQKIQLTKRCIKETVATKVITKASLKDRVFTKEITEIVLKDDSETKSITKENLKNDQETKEINKVVLKDGDETEFVTVKYPRVTNQTNDKVFLLSIEQFESHLRGLNIAIATLKNEIQNNDTGISWWLQDEGYMGSDKVIVDKSGKTVDIKSKKKNPELQFSVDGCSNTVGIRPAIFIKKQHSF